MANVMEPTSNTPVEAAAAALATATALPMTATDEDILTLVGNLARIARSLGELTAAARTAGRTGALSHHTFRPLRGL